jgi:hypothetical protein
VAGKAFRFGLALFLPDKWIRTYWPAKKISQRYEVNALLIVLFGLLQIADGVVTYFGLGSAQLDEVNPALNGLVGLFGLGYSITLIKLAGLAFVTFLFFDRKKMKSLWITATLASAVTFYSWVVSRNVILVVDAYLLLSGQVE